MKQKWFALLCAVLIAVLLTPDCLAIRYGDVVRITNPNAVNVRKGPGTGYGIIGEAQPDNVYVYLGTENGWHRIIFTGDTEGYVSGNRTTIETGLVPDYAGSGEKVSAVVKVTHYNALNVRKGPGKSYGVIGEAKPGTSWPYLGTDDGWNIIDFNGKTGYIAANRTEVDTVAGATYSEPEYCGVCDCSGLCMTCMGEGEVYNRNNQKYMTCPTCSGSGDCWQCGGTGSF